MHFSFYQSWKEIDKKSGSFELFSLGWSFDDDYSVISLIILNFTFQIDW